MEAMARMDKILKQRKLVFVTASDVLSRSEALVFIDSIINDWTFSLKNLKFSNK